MKQSFRHIRRYAVTTGDPDGIGLEVTYKALLKARLPANVQLFVFSSHSTPPFLNRLRNRLIKKFGAEVYSAVVDDSFVLPKAAAKLVLIESKSSAPTWVVQVAKLCYKGILTGMITGPLSKTLIASQGLNDIGHTEILRRVAKAKTLHMGFIGKHFNVVLATGHIPISRVNSALNKRALRSAISHAQVLKRALSSARRRQPLALVGLNPHAGESGLIGNQEKTRYLDTLAWSNSERINVVGPLVPDAAFLPNNWAQYSVFVCPYHDQGLIPFKMIHGADSGAHITLGLPFVRTSVDHGTARDLFGKNRANPNSMIEALNLAFRLTKPLR